MTGAAGTALDVADEGFLLEFQLAGGVWEPWPLRSCGDVRFEDVLPVRPIRFEKGLRHFSGWWYFATTGAHVGFESWLERDHLMLMDFDPRVRAVSSQPFWLHWRDGRGRTRRHAPDFFARLDDGTAAVVDVRPDDRIPARDAETLTASVCQAAGWDYRRSGDLDPVLVANVRWLSRYRHQRCMAPEIARVLLGVFAGGRELFEGAELAGDRLRVLPVLFHLMWRRQLAVDLTAGPLGMAGVVHAGASR